MKVDLLKYMTDRYGQKEAQKTEVGPVITISREYGCPAKKVATGLAKILTDKMLVKGIDIQWKWVSKEILFESAKELELAPTNIKYVFNYEQKSLLDDILASHSYKYYKSDRKIRNTIAKVIRSIGKEGHSIIVGRGGVAITRDIPKSLHVNLEAPLEWRMIRASEKHSISLEEARKMAIDVDKKRRQFREYFEGKNTDYTRFDMCFNCMTLSVDEIIQTIAKVVELRNLY